MAKKIQVPIETVVFGAAGFVGTYLVDVLPEHSFLAVDIDKAAQKRFAKQKIKSACRDITNLYHFNCLPADIACVINLASLQPARVSSDDFDPQKYIEVNTIGALNIAKYCVRNGIPKLIHVVSHRGTMLDYSDNFAEFAISEMAAIQMLFCYREKHQLQTIILRIPNVFGYGPHLEGFINGQYAKTGFQIFIDNAKLGKPLEVWGNPHASRNIVYVKDVVSAILLAMKSKNANGVYDIASNQPLSLDEEAKMINNVFSPKRKGDIVYRPDKKNDIEKIIGRSCNTQRAYDDFGWSPQYSFKEMLIDYKEEWYDGRFSFLTTK